MSLLVELKNVSVTYSTGVDALNNVSLKINDAIAFVVGSSAPEKYADQAHLKEIVRYERCGYG